MVIIFSVLCPYPDSEKLVLVYPTAGSIYVYLKYLFLSVKVTCLRTRGMLEN